MSNAHKAAVKDIPNARVAGIMYADPKANVTMVWDDGLERRYRIGILQALLRSEIEAQ